MAEGGGAHGAGQGSGQASGQASGHERAPGPADEMHGSPQAYLLGFGFAVILTAASFWAAGTDLVWAPGIPVLLAVLAVAQMGVHLVFFLNISSAPDQTNNVLALAFGLLVVGLVIGGSLWIMANLNANMMPMDQMMDLHRQK